MPKPVHGSKPILSGLYGYNAIDDHPGPEETQESKSNDGFVCVDGPSPSILTDTEATTMGVMERKQSIKDDRSIRVTELLEACEGLCFEKHVRSKLFYCPHPECEQEQQASGAIRKLLCQECGAFSHRKKSHPFNKSTNHVQYHDKPIKLEPDTEQYSNGLKAARAIKGFENLNQTMANQRWFSGALWSICGPTIVKEALDFFFHDSNPNKFNEKKVNQTYNRLAVLFHHQMENGDREQWDNLSYYCGVLKAILNAPKLKEGNNDANANPQRPHDAFSRSVVCPNCPCLGIFD
eukprot:190651_1